MISESEFTELMIFQTFICCDGLLEIGWADASECLPGWSFT